MDDLIGCQDVVAEVTEMLKKLPDLERLLSRLVVYTNLSIRKGFLETYTIVPDKMGYPYNIFLISP